MNMRDAENGTIVWEKNKWPEHWRDEEVEVGWAKPKTTKPAQLFLKPDNRKKKKKKKKNNGDAALTGASMRTIASPCTEAHIPKSIMQCKAVSREMNFSSKEAIQVRERGGGGGVVGNLKRGKKTQKFVHKL